MDKLETGLVDSPLAAVWGKFSDELHSSSTRLVSELEDCWRDVGFILEAPVQQIEAMSLRDLRLPLLESFQVARAQL